ncbi:hypothetical protein N7475_001029 [Penicillium sp. IBT 31633x]|nr:hypothetical protein N7475_001029 [Penicillium sp. IBT 31633x]
MSALQCTHTSRSAQLIRLGCLRAHINRPSTQRLHAISRTLSSLTSSNKPRSTSTGYQLSFYPRFSSSRSPARSFTDLKGSTGKAEADLLVEELQELYEVAKDEFEIATESTDTSTIYAASDRESARDALDQLTTVYGLYTARPGQVENEPAGSSSGVEETKDVPIIETNYDPADIQQSVKDEVRRRVGQRIRELKNAVELLEQRATED